MTGWAAGAIALSGVYLYVALYHGVIYWLRKRAPREFLLFSTLNVCWAFITLTSTGALSSPSLQKAAFFQNINQSLVMLSVPIFLDFYLHLERRQAVHLVRGLYLISAASIVAAATGLFFDPAFGAPDYTWFETGLLGSAEVGMTTLGFLHRRAIGLFALGSLGWIYIKGAGPRPDVRWAAFTLPAAFGIGMVAYYGDLPTHAIAGYAAILPTAGFTYVLVGRFTGIEGRLAARTEELARNYENLRMAEAQLLKNEHLASVGELSAVIAHEVRNPLAILKNAVAGLRRDSIEPQDALTLVDILEDETDRLNRLVTDLLSYAKPITPDTERLDMRLLVGNAVQLAAGGSGDISNIEVELSFDDDVEQIVGDETLLRHALINIVDNALQAMQNGGTLTIRCQNAGSERQPSVMVEVHDTGEGMDSLAKSRATEPFFTTRRSGTGLGLAIVDRVARAHGGAVELESLEREGTTVRFVVPCERAPSLPPEGTYTAHDL